jgi:hypothetical protein
VHFADFAPSVVLRRVHMLIKHTTSVRKVVIEHYSFFVPPQLRLEKVREGWSLRLSSAG